MNVKFFVLQSKAHEHPYAAPGSPAAAVNGRSGASFWRRGDRWYVVQTTIGDRFEWTESELAFEIPFLDTPGQSYAVTSGGQRLYTIVQAEDDVTDQIHVVSGTVQR